MGGEVEALVLVVIFIALFSGYHNIEARTNNAFTALHLAGMVRNIRHLQPKQ
jgi:hypothetical protein